MTCNDEIYLLGVSTIFQNEGEAHTPTSEASMSRFNHNISNEGEAHTLDHISIKQARKGITSEARD